MKSTLIASILAAASCATAASAMAGDKPFTGHEFSRQAKIDLTQARAIALGARPGRITDQELEKEAGGSGLRYSFDVRKAGVTYEVGVDASTGKVLENAREGRHPD